MNKTELDVILEKHKKWLMGEEGGERTDLHGANLFGADLFDVNLRDVNLHDANLSYANLRSADLHDANLSYANLRSANLFGADLHGANLHGADLFDVNLHDANLSYANLRSANLHGADLRDANLSGANLHYATGNGREVKSFNIGIYPVCITKHTIYVGCKQFPMKDRDKIKHRQLKEDISLKDFNKLKKIIKIVISDFCGDFKEKT